MFKLQLPQFKNSLNAPPGANLMKLLISKGVPVASSCQGDGICGKCLVMIQVISGQLPEAKDLEKKTLQINQCSEGGRLSCQLEVLGDYEVKTTYW